VIDLPVGGEADNFNILILWVQILATIVILKGSAIFMKHEKGYCLIISFTFITLPNFGSGRTTP